MLTHQYSRTLQSFHISFTFSAILTLILLTSCASQTKLPAKKSSTDSNPNNGAPTQIVPLSPFSTSGLKTLSKLRANNPALNRFLEKNRKPDYFFSTPANKIYCIYLSSDNLYTFAPFQNNGGPVRFHPLPAPIKASLKNISNNRTVTQMQAAAIDIPFSLQSKRSIEASLKNNQPKPYLNSSIINDIIAGKNEAKNKLYYYDLSLRDSIENEYSAKYETRKQTMKLIFPQAFNVSNIYTDPDFKAKKIYLRRNTDEKETSLIVPDFLPGSEFYRSSYVNIEHAFASLYQVKLTQNNAQINDLRFRYIIRLCQKDEAEQCVYRENNSTQIRAIVIAATLYNKRTGKIVETLTLK